jgi:uncharacterized SAM-binding protein YcdF (DUF218 family)
LGALVVFRLPLLGWAGRSLDVGTEPQSVDYVMVLGGGSDTRPFVAAALYKAGLARQILVPRMKPHPDRPQVGPPEEEMVRRVLRLRGVPAAAIVFLDDLVDSTHDEAAALRNFLADRPNSSVAIVTSNYHTRRVRWLFQKVVGDRAARLDFVSAQTDRFGPHNWWQSESGFVAYMNEFAKIGYYRLRY